MIVLDLPLNRINVPGERMRETFDKKKLAELKDSLSRLGQINPITVEDNPDTEGRYVLIAGERRLRAALDLGWPTIAAQPRSDVTELQHREIELEENVCRDDLTPVERAKAVAELHRLKSGQNSNWTQQQTAALMGSNRQADVANALRVDKMLQAFPELAKGTYKSFQHLKNIVDTKARSLARSIRVYDEDKSAKSSGTETNASDRIWLGDSVELIKSVPDEQFHLVLTDPPFGLDYDNKVSGTVGEVSAYEDSEASYQRLLSMAPDLYRVLRPDGWLVWFFGASWYGDRTPGFRDPTLYRIAAEGLRAGTVHPLVAAKLLDNTAEWFEDCRAGVVTIFRDAGFVVDELPIVWDRSSGKTFTRTPDRAFARAYDLALMCRKGEPNIVRRSLPNVISVKPVENSAREALVERPVELYEEFITRLTVPGEFVADFFVGSGSCPAAAAAQRRQYFGCELDPERRALAVTKVQSHTPTGFSPAIPEWITLGPRDRSEADS